MPRREDKKLTAEWEAHPKDTTEHRGTGSSGRPEDKAETRRWENMKENLDV